MRGISLVYISGEGLTPILKNHGQDLIGVEIGVCRGETSQYWLNECPNIKKLLCVDPWKEYPEMGQKQLDGYYRKAVENLAEYIKNERVVICKFESFHFGRLQKDRAFDFIFVDGNHTYESVLTDMRVWYPKVKPGGLITGHDWGKRGVIDAVHKFRKENKITSQIHRVKNAAWYFYK